MVVVTNGAPALALLGQTGCTALQVVSTEGWLDMRSVGVSIPQAFLVCAIYHIVVSHHCPSPTFGMRYMAHTPSCADGAVTKG